MFLKNVSHQLSDDWKGLINDLVGSRPGNIRVFMYPGRVCNFQVGTRIPASTRFAQKEKILQQKQDGKKICRNSRMSESKIYQNHKFTQTDVQIFRNL